MYSRIGYIKWNQNEIARRKLNVKIKRKYAQIVK